mmetsp:Transcript_12397/g.44587  ORF Transcript_12397/g.44587 Transcript_12397/m.44587 type:complete len:204 (-) Transcript_12397:147-758(-)
MKASLRTRPPRADLRPVALRSCIHGNVAGEVGEIGVVDAAGRGAAAIAAAAGGGKAGAGASFLGDCATSARRWSSSLLCPPPAPPPRPSRSLLSGVGPPTGAAFAVSDFVSVAAVVGLRIELASIARSSPSVSVASARGSGSEREWRRADDGVVAVATVSPLPCTLIRRRLKKPRGFRARARSPAASRVRARRRARGRERCLW